MKRRTTREPDPVVVDPEPGFRHSSHHSDLEGVLAEYARPERPESDNADRFRARARENQLRT